MKIKRLEASFGSLSGAEMTLSSGMNVICAPNEAGKSTWCAFIRAMLYGISTREKTTLDRLADKERYQPWNGGPMSGTMDVSHSGRDLTIQRSALRGIPMKDLSVTVTGTGLRLTELETQDLGAALTGLPESVFRRTSFIGQSGLRVDQDSELERRISSLVTSGDENSSATEAEKKLKGWQRAIRSPRGLGTLPELEAALRENEEKLTKIRELSSRAAETKRAADGLAEEKARLERLLEQHKAYALQQQQLKAAGAAKDVSDAKAETDALERELTLNGRRITRPDISEIRAALASLSSMNGALRTAKESADSAGTALAEAEAAEKASPLYGYSPEQVGAAEREAEELRCSDKKRSPAKTVLFAVLTLALVLTTIAAAITTHIVPAMILLAFTAAAAVFFAVNAVSFLRERRRLEAFFKKFNVSALSSFRPMAENYLELCRLRMERQAAFEGAKIQVKTVSSAVSSTERALFGISRQFWPEETSPGIIAGAADRCEAAMERLGEAAVRLESGRRLYESIKIDGSVPAVHVEKPEGSPEDLSQELALVSQRQTALMSAYNLSRGESRAVGDPLVLSGDVKSLKEAISGQSLKFDALSLAIEVLSAADSDMQARFSPVICREAGRIMKELTGGKYEALAFDRSFDASARASGDTVSRGVLSLSCGTADQIYLSLRLAMCGILKGAEPCPIILDDALANFDDERAAAALEYLCALGKSRQILLFSCHGREAACLSGHSGVNIVQAKK